MGSSISSIGYLKPIDLQKFYDTETLGVRAPDCSCPVKAISHDDRKVLKMFNESCTLEDSRYTIGLPWKRNPSELPNNYELVKQRLYCLERSLLKNKQKENLYKAAVREYIDNGWAEEISEDDVTSSIYYLPHHGVYRPDKVSTPLRVVFDPACVFKGVSLNSFLYKGPCLIGNLLGVLLRFREEEFAFTGDISKMYLQIRLPESDTQVHRFLWRDMDSTRDPKAYHLMRVAFGDKPSPDMASFVMLRMAEKYKHEYPLAAAILERDRYVDDLIHSCSTREQAISKMSELDYILSTGSFRIKKWHCSGDRETEQTTDASNSNLYQTSDFVSLDREDTIKALGVVCKPQKDTVSCVVKGAELGTLTKRIILSKIAGIYDPLGLASAVTIKSRIALQDIWPSQQFDWDDKLPQEVSDLWHGLFQDLKGLELVELPRSVKPIDAFGTSELHVFADASMSAYGAVAYILWPVSNGKEVQLLSAKARVAPLKQDTIPRLELMGALIAARLAKTIVNELKEKPSQVFLWSDSQIALRWIQSESLSLKAFVGIRVAEIQSLWEREQWRYVPTSLNPADSLSRGINAEDMHEWFRGPEFLRGSKENWPENVQPPVIQDDTEMKKNKTICAVKPAEPLVSSCSSWNKLLRITAFSFRFIYNARTRSGHRLYGALQIEELAKAESYLLKEAQRDLHDWQNKYKDLSPFFQDGLIRVGGRLRRSPLEYDQVHPILLPSSHQVSRLLMSDTHSKMGHVGPERTLCESRRTVWVVRGRNLARSIVKNCVVCRKLRQRPHSTLMADLPPDRMKPYSPPFSVTGVDLFGPFRIKFGRNKTKKAWGAIFTCATVRAVHLELVDGLSTPAFLQALRRFVAHHGWPNTFLSDNGTSFVGAQKELRKLYEEGKTQISEFASLHKVNWKFITPLIPHQGGLYESLIKQTKTDIRVAIGQQILSWEEMTTIFAEVECLLNSRPIGYPTNHPDDYQPLTPNHFLIGRASVEVPQGPFHQTRNLHKRFEFVQSLVNQIWKRFIREYVPTLMKRNKWQKKGRQLQVGDIVLLADPFASRGKWDMARVVEIYPGSDGIIRNVKVRTRNGEYKRSIQRCCLILENSD